MMQTILWRMWYLYCDCLVQKRYVADVVHRVTLDAKTLGYQQRVQNDLLDFKNLDKITEAFYLWIDMVILLPCLQIFTLVYMLDVCNAFLSQLLNIGPKLEQLSWEKCCYSSQRIQTKFKTAPLQPVLEDKYLKCLSCL